MKIESFRFDYEYIRARFVIFARKGRHMLTPSHTDAKKSQPASLTLSTHSPQARRTREQLAKLANRLARRLAQQVALVCG